MKVILEDSRAFGLLPARPEIERPSHRPQPQRRTLAGMTGIRDRKRALMK